MVYSIELYKQPNNLNFSKNSIPFGFSINPFTDLNVSSRHRLYITILFSYELANPVFEELWNGTLAPDRNGYCLIDVSSIVDAKLEFFTPNPNIKKFYKCHKQFGIFKIKYYLVDNNNILSDQNESDPYYVYKGGVAKEDVDNGGTYLHDTIYSNRSPLHYYHAAESVRLNQPKWLYFIYKRAAGITAEQILLSISYIQTDGWFADYPIIVQDLLMQQYAVYCVPVDIISIDLQSYAPDYSLVKYYQVQIQDQNAEDIVLSGGLYPLTFYIDRRPFYEEQHLLYRQSLGSLESQSVLGDKEFSVAINGDSIETLTMADMIGDVLIHREVSDPRNTLTNVVKGNTGWVTKAEILRLRDLLLNKEVWKVYGKRLLPVFVSTRNTLLFKQSERLYSMSIDVSTAYSDENTNPELIVDFGDICPAVDYIGGGCNKGGFIWVKWKLPPGYDKIQFYYTVDIYSGTIFEIAFSGNIGQASIDINSASNTSVDNFVVTIKARCICNDEVSPYSYGPYTNSIVINGASLIPPVANDDIADEGNRDLSARVLKFGGVDMNVLTNDTTSNGGQLSFDGVYDASGTVSGATSANGANILQNGAGGILYTPTPLSMANFAEDVIYYKCQEYLSTYGNIQSNVAIIRVPLKSQIPKVYVKYAFANIIETSYRKAGHNHIDRRGELYFQFFLDAACTIPIDVSSLGIVIAYDVSKEQYQYSSSASGTQIYGWTFEVTKTIAGQNVSTLANPDFWINHWTPGSPAFMTNRRIASNMGASTGNWVPVGW